MPPVSTRTSMDTPAVQRTTASASAKVGAPATSSTTGSPLVVTATYPVPRSTTLYRFPEVIDAPAPTRWMSHSIEDENARMLAPFTEIESFSR